MPQMPDSFKPIDMPDSFQPISVENKAEEQPGLLTRTWNTLNTPLVDIRSGGLKTATEEFAAEHPYIGKSMNFATDVLSSLTSPLSVGLGLLTGGSSVAEAAGAKGLATALEVPGKVAAGGMVGHGGYNLLRPSATPEERVGGALEAGLGGLGLRSSPKILERPKVEVKPTIEVPKVNVDELQPSTALAVKESDVAPRLAGFQNTGNGILYLQFDRVGQNVSPKDIESMFPGFHVSATKFKENLLSPHIQKFRVDVFDENGRISSRVAKMLEDQMGGSFHDWERPAQEMFANKPTPTQPELNPKSEPSLPLTPEVAKPTEVPVTTEPKPAAIKLLDALKESKPLNAKQRELYKLERAEKFGQAAGVKVSSEGDLGKFFGALKGEHIKVRINPLREVLSQPEIDELFGSIGDSPLTVPEQANAFKGLEKLLSGGVPTDYDISQLGRVFGEDFSTQLQKQMPWTARRIILEAGSIPKALKSAADFGLPFRQGRNYAYRQSWFKSIIPMMKAYGSQSVYDARMGMIKERPLFQKALDAGIEFSDLASRTSREESAISSLVGNAPLVKQSNRAATVFANELRMNEFESQYARLKNIYESGMKIAKTPEEVQAAKLSNPDNPYVASKLADQINTASGRGKLPGNLGRIASELNAFIFSPKLMSSRIRSINRILNGTLNPMARVSKFERVEAVKQLLSIAAAGATEATITYQIAKAAGKEPSIETSPDSSDFMKVKIGDTRYDPFGGYQQYITPVFKILTQGATSTSPKSYGERYEFGKGKGYRQSGFDVAVDALANKASPVAGLGIGLLKGNEPGGRKINLESFSNPNPFENTATRYLTNPLIIQDIYEVIQDDPSLLPLIGADMFGQGVQVYDQKK